MNEGMDLTFFANLSPIGSHLGMNYASVYLGSWENTVFENSKTKPMTYFRFVDDVWGLWSDGLDSLKDFYKQLFGNG
jgi:hypothetical protein